MRATPFPSMVQKSCLAQGEPRRALWWLLMQTESTLCSSEFPFGSNGTIVISLLLPSTAAPLTGPKAKTLHWKQSRRSRSTRAAARWGQSPKPSPMTPFSTSSAPLRVSVTAHCSAFEKLHFSICDLTGWFCVCSSRKWRVGEFHISSFIWLFNTKSWTCWPEHNRPCLLSAVISS